MYAESYSAETNRLYKIALDLDSSYAVLTHVFFKRDL